MKKAIVLALAVIATVGGRCQRAGQPDGGGALCGQFQLQRRRSRCRSSPRSPAVPASSAPSR